MYTPRSHTPPTSPPSSPSSSTWTHSSSPVSSPSNAFPPLDHDASSDVEELCIDPPMHPYAGSYHANPSRKRPSHALVNSPPPTPSKKARVGVDISPFPLIRRSSRDADAFRQEIEWEEAVEGVYETGERKIDLVGKNITHIPPTIIRDLAKIVVLPETGKEFEDVQSRLMSTHPPAPRAFGRTRTAPASTLRLGPQGKTMSSSSVLGASRNYMELFLGQNSISKLPVELWRLQNLTLLSLRNNKITYLPPEIAQLTELVELNVAHNKLRYIPAELLSMKKLKKPFLFPNPFLPPPPSSTQASPLSAPTGQSSFNSKVVSETKPTSADNVPSLTELCLRSLLCPPIDDDEYLAHDEHNSLPSASQNSQASSTLSISKPKTRLEEIYELPLATDSRSRGFSASLRHILGVCVPGSILAERNVPPGRAAGLRTAPTTHAINAPIVSHAAPAESPTTAAPLEDDDDDDDARAITGAGVCPNPAHGVIPSVFVHHAEERFTWETSTPVATLGGAAAVRWRGCMRGCLDFLDPPKVAQAQVQPPAGEAQTVPLAGGGADADRAAAEAEGDDMQMDLDEADIVQTISFSVEPLGFE